MSTGRGKLLDYIGISKVSSMEVSGVPSSRESGEYMLNLKDTELRLGLPGSESPERKTELCLLVPNEGKNHIFLSPSKGFGSGPKRGFLKTVDGSKTMDDKWAFPDLVGAKSGMKKTLGQNCANNGVMDHPLSSFHSPRASPTGKTLTATDGNRMAVSVTAVKDVNAKERPRESRTPSDDPALAPVAKAQVVGWPPIRSYRKNTMANPVKNVVAEDKSCSQCLYVKVSMDGAPYLRKIDLKNYHTYQELSAALEKLFSCFTIGQCGSHGGAWREELSESRLVDLLHGSEYVLTYEDKDGDWMLVGDVPWEMFAGSCKKLRIMKGSEAIGLAPRAMEKCKNQN